MYRRDTDVTARVRESCPIAEALDAVGAKWMLGILAATAHGPVRFTELERALRGISRRMLTLDLRRLERDGLLTRTVHPVVPPRVEYALTDMGRELHHALDPLSRWSERPRSAVAAYDERAADSDKS